MHALFFTVRPHPGHLPHYFDHVARLKPVLARHDGLMFLDRYRSLADPQVLLSHQLWRDEDAITGWRRDPVHRASQSAGRHVHFADYRIRVGLRVLHWQTGDDLAPKAEHPAPHGPQVLALYGTHPVDLAGFDAYESVNHPGHFISLTDATTPERARSRLADSLGTAGLTQAATYQTVRDYGLADRAQVPADQASSS